MLKVYRKKLPASYLLILQEAAAMGPEVSLSRSLFAASLSDKPAVWLDCSLISSFSPEALGLLLTYNTILQQQGKLLLLTHVADELRVRLAQAALPAVLFTVPTLLDAARHPHLPKLIPALQKS